jgi:hypothetical protein
VLEALEQRVKQFIIREDLWPIRVPHDPLSLDEVIDQAIPEGRRTFDVKSLRSRTLLSLEWDDATTWDAWVIVLPSKIKLYCDSSHEESRILASGGRNEGDESDRIFLELLSNSAGAEFGIEFAGGAPSRVRSSMTDRAFLVEVFVNLYEVAGCEDEIRSKLDSMDATAGRSLDEPGAGTDFRADVERWLSSVMR